MSKRSQQLFDDLVHISENIRVAAEVFHEELKSQPDIGSLGNRMKEHENKGDEMVAALITRLNNTYITPLEREDFLELAVTMDDIIDGLDASSVRFDLFNIKEMTPCMIEFASCIRDCAVEIEAAMLKLRDKRLLQIRDHVGELNRLEKRADQLLRHALRTLFAEVTDPLEVMKHKELYEILENITDRCEDVADVLESVIIKNA